MPVCFTLLFDSYKLATVTNVSFSERLATANIPRSWKRTHQCSNAVVQLFCNRVYQYLSLHTQYNIICVIEDAKKKRDAVNVVKSTVYNSTDKIMSMCMWVLNAIRVEINDIVQMST